jgi:hypothetical protein
LAVSIELILTGVQAAAGGRGSKSALAFTAPVSKIAAMTQIVRACFGISRYSFIRCWRNSSSTCGWQQKEDSAAPNDNGA